jgi:hypothetical protein
MLAAEFPPTAPDVKDSSVFVSMSQLTGEVTVIGTLLSSGQVKSVCVSTLAVFLHTDAYVAVDWVEQAECVCCLPNSCFASLNEILRSVLI